MNVNTFTMMLIYSVDGQSDRVVSVAILNSFVCVCVLYLIHFACRCKKKEHFLRYFVSVAAAVAILKVARKSILFCLLLYLEVTYCVI